VNEDSLKNGKEGKVQIDVAAGKTAVRLPLQAAQILGTYYLVFKM